MALTSLVADADGDSAASSSVRVLPGYLLVALTNSSDLTSVAISVEFQPIGDSDWIVMQANAATLSNDSVLYNGFVGHGELRVNITGGGSGDNIDVGYENHQFMAEGHGMDRNITVANSS